MLFASCHTNFSDPGKKIGNIIIPGNCVAGSNFILDDANDVLQRRWVVLSELLSGICKPIVS